MKKNILPASKAALGFILGTGLIFSSLPSYSKAADPDDTNSLAEFEVIRRTYDSDSGNLIRYHYEDEDGNTVELSKSETEKLSSDSSKRAINIPASYDLRSQNVITPIKDQGRTGACWSFAAIKSLESNIALKNMTPSEGLDLSESHLIWYTYHPSTTASDPLYKEGAMDSTMFSDNTSAYDAGGNAILTSFILARWTGAATESAAPFHANTQTELANMANNMASQSEDLRYRSDYLVTDAICYDGATQSEIKRMIMENGAMDVSYYHDTDSSLYHKTESGGTAYYQNKRTGKNAIASANHSVTIVGWDDNYSRENFGNAKPSSNGAWLIANSYGSSFGEDGYFWLSYEEPSLTEFYSFIAASADTYDNNYQYDGYGWGNAITNSHSDSTRAANIFTANDDYKQTLSAVGVYTVADKQPYTINIYRSVSAGKPTSGKLAASISGVIDYQGYHTIPLNETVSLNPGEKFSVVVSYQITGEETGYIPLEGESYYENPYRVTYTSNTGESFIYSDGVWVDLHNSKQKGIENNVCIKAFTKNGMAAGDITLSKSKATLGVGETLSLTASVRNIEDQAVTYSSSSPSVASVDSTGKITAKKAGTAHISASLVSGKTASIVVTVKKAPSKITVSPAKKKTIKKSKSFQIKINLPGNSYSSHITYTSSKPSIAKVTSSGKVTGKKKGKSVITIKTHNGKTAKITVTVK